MADHPREDDRILNALSDVSTKRGATEHRLREHPPPRPYWHDIRLLLLAGKRRPRSDVLEAAAHDQQEADA